MLGGLGDGGGFLAARSGQAELLVELFLLDDLLGLEGHVGMVGGLHSNATHNE